MGSIPAIKGVEVGYGFADAARTGSLVHDPFVLRTEDGSRWVGREGNNAGGLEGGMSTGMPLVVRAAMKPIPTLTTPLPSVDLATMEAVEAHVERSDVIRRPRGQGRGGGHGRLCGGGRVPAKSSEATVWRDVLDAVAAYERRLEERGLWRRS